MGKPTGFIDYLRELPLDRPALERIRDWNEFHRHMPEAGLRQQGARCMDCGIPFCHTGTLLSGMASGCPINNLIPEWNDLVYRGLWHEALDRLHKTNNFPEFTGRVCPGPVRGLLRARHQRPRRSPSRTSSAPSSTAAGTKAGSAPNHPTAAPARRSPSSAPAPPACCAAAQLNRAGHTVTVFERADRIGGLLMYGIPNMKLDKRRSSQRRVDLMAPGRRHVRHATPRSARTIRPTQLLTGLRRRRPLHRRHPAARPARRGPRPQRRPLRDGLPHRQHAAACSTAQARASLHLAPTARTSSSSAAATPAPTASAPRCATAAAASCSSRSSRSRPIERAAGQSLARVAQGLQASTTARKKPPPKFGADPRVYLTTVKQFVGDANGQRQGSRHRRRSEWDKDDKGQLRAPGSARHREGAARRSSSCWRWASSGPEQPLLEQLGVERDPRTNVKAEHGKYATSMPGRLRRRRLPPRPEPRRLGASTKAAAPPANATATSWAAPACRKALAERLRETPRSRIRTLGWTPCRHSTNSQRTSSPPPCPAPTFWAKSGWRKPTTDPLARVEGTRADLLTSPSASTRIRGGTRNPYPSSHSCSVPNSCGLSVQGPMRIRP
ncbi:MAG: FAD-dependent oxidoreductase [Marinilabiliales bacterium]|nr:FAD-dependent oxidoreductase [Marinilabiliales bacterium]